MLLNNLIFALETLVTKKIHKRPNLITLFEENNKVIRLKFVDYHYATKVKKTKIRFQSSPAINMVKTTFILNSNENFISE